jgi:hypothetical protein
VSERTYDVAAYIWPAYTGDEPRSLIFWPNGEGEWQTVRTAESKYQGHDWPRKPLWGYENEADPRVMEKQIDAAADHGVNVFIYDWYWYDQRPFLEQCLNNGYLQAANRNRVKFYLMWANHDVKYVWDKRLAHVDLETVIWQAAVGRTQFEQLTERLIDRYFTHPCYYRIEGRPVFQIYDLNNLIHGLGGLDATADALVWFEEAAKRAGLPGVFLQLTSWGARHMNLSGVDANASLTAADVVTRLGFAGQTHYQFCHFANIDRDYREIMVDVQAEWQRMDRDYAIPYFPHVSVGWDNNPRFETFRPGVVKNNTPQEVRNALVMARDYIDAHPDQPPLITINSWNEWTETSYLQPDDLYGYGYLEAVREAFT